MIYSSRIFPTFLLTVCLCSAFGQTTRIRGKVTDASSGDPIPFANVYVKPAQKGITTSFDGLYSIEVKGPADSIVVSYVGYVSRTKPVTPGIDQVIHFQLTEENTNLETVVVHAGENPAFRILREAVDRKEKHDKRSLPAFEYDTYTKTEIDVNHISPKIREGRVMKKISQVLDSIDRIAGEDGTPILPLLITESTSRLYYKSRPDTRKEQILKTRVHGVGVDDGTLITQLIGSSFQEYNFYQNWLNILTRDFVSPLSDGWRLFYQVYLTDSLMIGNDFCYRIDFYPRSSHERAFTGTMWITHDDFALRQIDATIARQADVNFVEKIRIQQELTPVDGSHWLPVRNRMLVDVGELGENKAGILAKFYTSNKNFDITSRHDNSFYEIPIEVNEDARLHEEDAAWDSLRHEPLSSTEKNVLRMIDTLRHIPVIKTYTDIIKVLIDGYFTHGKVDLGPYLGLVGWNNLEGVRVQGGFRTNARFSTRWVLGGELAYGFDDHRVKYLGYAQRILDRKKWTTLTLRVRRDLTRVGVDDETLADNPLFLVATRWGTFRRGYYFDEARLSFSRTLFRGLTQRVSVRTWDFSPTYEFGYFNPEQTTGPVLSNFRTTELTFETRIARDELFVLNGNQRVSMGTTRSPTITLRYTHGFRNVAGSDFDYDKVRINISKRMKTGPFGYAMVTATGEYVFNDLPYPLLALHLGNQSPFYTPVTYNLMNYGEFVSDHYVALNYRQYFEGFLLNRIPVIRSLNWRLLATANVIMGGMRQSNRALISPTDPLGHTALLAGTLKDVPYVEVGYGVENILQFIRIDFVHRLTYLDNPDARSFGILFTAQFQL